MKKHKIVLTIECELPDTCTHEEELPEFDVSYSVSAVGGNLHWATVIKTEILDWEGK